MMLQLSLALFSVLFGVQAVRHGCGPNTGKAYFDGDAGARWKVGTGGAQIMDIYGSWETTCSRCAEYSRDLIEQQGYGDKICMFCVKKGVTIFATGMFIASGSEDDVARRSSNTEYYCTNSDAGREDAAAAVDEGVARGEVAQGLSGGSAATGAAALAGGALVVTAMVAAYTCMKRKSAVTAVDSLDVDRYQAVA